MSQTTQEQIRLLKAIHRATCAGSSGTTTSGSVDFEIGCSSVDGRTVVRVYVQDALGVITSQVFEQNGTTPVTDGSILVACDTGTPMGISGTTNIPVTCGDISKNEVLGYNRLRNGDFEESIGVGATSVPTVGWETTYTAVDVLDTAPIGSYLLFEGDLGAHTNGNYSMLSTSKAAAFKSLGTGTPPLFEFTSEFEAGKSYRLTGSVAYFVEFGTVGVVQSSDELNTIIIPQPAIEGFFEQFTGEFTWVAPTGEGTIKFAQSGLSTSDPIILFDNLQVREIMSPTQVANPTVTNYSDTVKSVIDQVVNTVGCNDERRDNLLVDIADVISESSTKLEKALGNGSDWELLEVELVDDQANDGTGAIIPYSELYKVDPDGTRTLIATVDQKGANYTLVGTRRSASEIGVLAKTGANQFVLRGPATWSPTEAMQQFMYAVINIATPLVPPTYRGSNNVVSELFDSESSEYIVLSGTDKFDVTNIQITANTGDIIKISYNEITI